MKCISWNVNGIRAAYRKGLDSFVSELEPDILCLQETKAQPEQLDETLQSPPGYLAFYSSAEKKGYSGVVTFVKKPLAPKTVRLTIGVPEFDSEGRFCITDFGSFILYNIYFPSGTTGDIRQNFKYAFLAAVYDHIASLPESDRNRLVVAGDFNICHRPIDIHHPVKAEKLALSGFLPDERRWMDAFVELGFVDSFRHIKGDVPDIYSWWTYRAGARPKNLGWRIDYFFVARALEEKITGADILTGVPGSDHAPIVLEFGR